ncbi:hypothetical protein BC940DRAFT_31516 [Gongronella butleri]|nr:hypothetical protein BC940DRAFT_31516 [Gongronella butleri]
MFVHSPFLEDSMAFSSLYSPGLPSTVYHPPHSLVAPSPSGIVAAQITPFPAWSSETPLAQTGMKRSRSHMVQRSSSQNSSLADEMPVKKHARKSGLTLFINTKKNVSDLTCVELEQPTVQQLISKLSGILHLQANSVSEVLWRRNLASSTATNVIHHLHLSPAKKSSLILVEDSVIEYFPNQTIMSVEWEISASGLVRLILEF